MTKRFLAIVTVLMLALTSVVAFAEADTTETASVDWTEPYAEPVEVHIAIEEPANAVFAEGEDYSNNLWTKRWKELYNVNVIVDWVSNEYDTKMNLSIASSTLPDIYKVNAVQSSQLKQAGSLQDLTETYNTYASDSIKTMMKTTGTSWRPPWRATRFWPCRVCTMAMSARPPRFGRAATGWSNPV